MLYKLDLINENAVELFADYSCVIELNDAPILTDYNGYCYIKVSVESADIILQPKINILTVNSLEISIAFNEYPSTIKAGTFEYDVLLIKKDNSHRFYAVGGKIQLLKRVTVLTTTPPAST